MWKSWPQNGHGVAVAKGLDECMHDLIIRNGRIVDGSGSTPFVGHIAIDAGRISEVVTSDSGHTLGPAEREIDATDKLVTPGFVDIHTHYDGQATWDEELAPSSEHGVTTVVFGNCGVGFAPAHPDRHQFLIELMEGVEDIPGAALSEGMTWDWESFPEFLDALDRRSYCIDIAAMVAHGPVRAYVMGERGAKNEPATPDEIRQMATIVTEAVEAGAMGFSTSRTIIHTAIDGEPVPGTFAAEDELFALGHAVADAGRGIFEVAPAGVAGEDLIAPERELDWICRLATQTKRPVTWLMLQNDGAPEDWRKLMKLSEAAQVKGDQVVPQVAGRPFGILLGLSARHRFLECPSFAEIREMSTADKAQAMANPDLRQALIEESKASIEAIRAENPLAARMMENFDNTFPLGDPVDYEPAPEDSIGGRARAEGHDPLEVYYDALLARGGSAILMQPFLGYSHGNGDALHEMLNHPGAILGLADGGAHCNLICDASTPTWMLTHWTRDRTRGPLLDLAAVIKKMTADTAALFNLSDRGRIEVGLRADLNIIDYENLSLHEPVMVADLPAGGTRFLQPATGYCYTLVAGEITRQDDQFTGARPGQLVRSAAEARSVA